MQIGDEVLPTDDSGDGVSGTKTNRSFWAAFKAAINTIIHSSTNPTVYVKNIIDEVVTARGGFGDVDARLDDIESDVDALAATYEYIHSNGVQVGNVGAGTDALNYVSIPASPALQTGDALEIECWGECANNTNLKTLIFNVAGSTLWTQGPATLQQMKWRIHAIVQKISSTQISHSVTLYLGYGMVAQCNSIWHGNETLVSNALSGILLIGCDGVGVATNDIVHKSTIVKILRAS